MIRIIIVDDHPIVRQGLRHIIHEEPDMEIVGEAENAQAAFVTVRQKDCDVVILDLHLPDISGFEVLKRLKYEYPSLPFLILSMLNEEHYALRVLKAGASGYLKKEDTPAALIEAIRKVISGRKYLSPSLAELLVDNLEGFERPPHDKLSNREFQILGMIASGQSIKEISANLCLSGKTVSTYRKRILEKMHMHTNAELVSYALKNNLIS